MEQKVILNDDLTLSINVLKDSISPEKKSEIIKTIIAAFLHPLGIKLHVSFTSVDDEKMNSESLSIKISPLLIPTAMVILHGVLDAYGQGTFIMSKPYIQET